jgi:hypothetical protein
LRATRDPAATPHDVQIPALRRGLHRLKPVLDKLKGDTQMIGAAYFYLGCANYQMRNCPEAVRFNQQCLALKGPYQENAARSLEVIRNEAASQ